VRIQSWPTAIVLIVALVALAAAYLAGPSLGVPAESHAELVGALGALAAIVLGLMRSILGRDEDGDGTPDVFQRGRRRPGEPRSLKNPAWPPPPPPPDPPTPSSQGPGGAGALLLACILAAATLTTACEPGALQLQARGATITAGAVGTAGGAVDAARDHALDQVEEEHPQHGLEREAALRLEHARWIPLGAALDSTREGLLLWIEALDTARLAGGGEELLGALLPLGARVVLAYQRAAEVAGALGVDLPELPTMVIALARGVGGAR